MSRHIHGDFLAIPPTVRQVYGRDVDAPDGYEFTEEFRLPGEIETYMGTNGQAIKPLPNRLSPRGPRLILRDVKQVRYIYEPPGRGAANGEYAKYVDKSGKVFFYLKGDHTVSGECYRLREEEF